MVVIVVLTVMIIMSMIDPDNCVVVIMIMPINHHRTIVMIAIVIVTIIHAHTNAARTDVEVLGDRYGGNCYCQAKNNSERREIFHFEASFSETMTQ